MLALFFYIGVLAPKDMSAAERENRELKQMPAFNAETVFSGTFPKILRIIWQTMWVTARFLWTFRLKSMR